MSTVKDTVDYRTSELTKKQDNDPASDEQAKNGNTPSITSNGRDSLSKQPPSRASGKSKRDKVSTTSRPEKVNADADSISGSIQSSGSIRRTEAERILYFKNQPECGELEPHRPYNVRIWEVHRAKCDARAGDSPHNPLRQETMDTESTAASSLADSSHRRTEADRKALLEADTCAEVVQPCQVKCRTCQKWIQLSKRCCYELSHWKKHKERCSRPSHRVAAAERTLRLVNDVQAKSFDMTYVQCSLCDRKIVLEGGDDYNLINWHEHKANCSKELKSTGVESADSADTLIDMPNTLIDFVPFPSEDVPAEDDTPTPQFPSHKILKRARSPSNVHMTSEDDRPANRPRRESIVDFPSALDWIFLPLKAFVCGFRESLGDDVQTNP
ncbi:hypothetical protein APHAL10511_004302 [Amanita phalloides]|nr:hypothetical protein APHAL10511_004302 [Amanita phalloides]